MTIQGTTGNTAAGYVVTGRSTNEPGRYILESGAKALLADSALVRKRPAVALSPIELLVAGLSACAVASVESDSEELGIPVAGVTAEVTAIRDEADETRFASIIVALTIRGVGADQAEQLTSHLRNQCPIYNTLRRGGPVEIRLAVDEGRVAA